MSFLLALGTIRRLGAWRRMIPASEFPADPAQTFTFDEIRTFQAGHGEHKLWACYGLVVSNVIHVVDEAFHKWSEFWHRDY